MKIFTEHGTKERLFEIMKRVNKDLLTEDFNINNPNNELVLGVLNEVLNGSATINSVNSMTKDDGNQYIDLTGVDSKGNKFVLNFKASVQKNEIDGVFTVEDVELKQFDFTSSDGESIHLEDEDLDFINKDKDLLMKIADNYLNVDSGNEFEIDEELAKKIDSYPFGGGSEKFQTGKNYGDNKPVNPKLRVHAQELDKFVQEDDMSAQDSRNFVQEDDKNILSNFEKRELINQAIKELMDKNNGRIPSAKEIQEYVSKVLADRNKAKMNEDDYPTPMGKEFKPDKTNYPKKKKKQIKTIKIKEDDGDEDRYENVVFMQGDDAIEPLNILDEKGVDAALDYLKQWHQPGIHSTENEIGCGTSDEKYEKDGYIMCWNAPLGYIGLVYDTKSNIDEEDVPEVEKENPDLYPPGWKDVDGIFLNHGGIMKWINKDKEGNEIGVPKRDGSGKGIGINAGRGCDALESTGDVELPNNADDVEKIAKEKEEMGDVLHGGLGDDKSPLDFDTEQIIRGMKVEMEHTNNPLIAVEIVLDHLSEDPSYYGSDDEDPEKMAQQGAEKDAEEGKESEKDKEVTDELLGYKPLNVGDYENEEVSEVDDIDLKQFDLEIPTDKKAFKQARSDINKDKDFNMRKGKDVVPYRGSDTWSKHPLRYDTEVNLDNDEYITQRFNEDDKGFDFAAQERNYFDKEEMIRDEERIHFLIDKLLKKDISNEEFEELSQLIDKWGPVSNV